MHENTDRKKIQRKTSSLYNTLLNVHVTKKFGINKLQQIKKKLDQQHPAVMVITKHHIISIEPLSTCKKNFKI